MILTKNAQFKIISTPLKDEGGSTIFTSVRPPRYTHSVFGLEAENVNVT